MLNGICRLVCSQPSSPLSHKNLERFARRPLKDTPGAPEFDYITAIPTDSGIHLGEWAMVFKSRCQSLWGCCYACQIPQLVDHQPKGGIPDIFQSKRPAV